MSALIYVIVPKPLFRCCLKIHSFLCGTSNGTVSRNNRAEIRQLVILSNYYTHKTVAAAFDNKCRWDFLLQFPSRSEHCFSSLLIKCDSPTTLVVFLLLFFLIFHCPAETIAAVLQTQKGQAPAAKKHSQVILTSALSPAGRTVPDRVTQEKCKQRKKVRDEWRLLEESESPDGTVKRIHNGNTTLALFRVLM